MRLHWNQPSNLNASDSFESPDTNESGAVSTTEPLSGDEGDDSGAAQQSFGRQDLIAIRSVQIDESLNCESVQTARSEKSQAEGSQPQDRQSRLNKDENDYSGDMLESKFALLELLGEGAGSRVYKAQHKFLQNLYAIKILKKVHLADSLSVERFKREARLAMRLIHDNIIKISGFGITRNSEPFIVMEYLEGQTVQKLIDSTNATAGAALTVGRQIASALECAHRQGVIHRDIKPSNILLTQKSENASSSISAKLLDFGLAKDISGTCTDSNLTLNKGSLPLGTPNYMSPEQCRMEPADRRSDIYALGCVMFEIATGRKPFDAQSDLAVMNMHLRTEHTFTEKDLLSQSLREIINKCMQKDPALRYQTAGELKKDLENCSPETQQTAAVRKSDLLKNTVSIAVLALILLGISQCFENPLSNLFHKKNVSLATNKPTHRPLRPRNNIQDFEDPVEILSEAKILLRGTPSHNHRPAFEEAEKAFLKARSIALKTKRKMVATKCYLELGEMYIQKHDYANADDISKQAFNEALESGATVDAVNALRQRARVAVLKDQNFRLAEKFDRAALNRCPEDTRQILAVRRDLAENCARNAKTSEAYKLLKENNDLLSELPTDEPEISDKVFNECSYVTVDMNSGHYADIAKHINFLAEHSKKMWNSGLADTFSTVATELIHRKQFNQAQKLVTTLMEFPESKIKPETRTLAAKLLAQCSTASN